MARDLPLISIVVPLYNEADNILPLYAEIEQVWQQLEPRYRREILFVNDGSRDQSTELLTQLAARDPQVCYLEFSRNFGKEIATSAGLHHAHGEAVILMDGDLQHPPRYIPCFIEQWEQGAEVVIGTRKLSFHSGRVQRLGSIIFYLIMATIGEGPVIRNNTDFRLLDRKVVNAFQQFTEHNRYTRGLIDWLGFNRVILPFNAEPRRAGQPAYSNIKLIRLALGSFISHSLFPLKFAGYLGFVITLLSGLLGFFIIMNQFILHRIIRHLIFSGPFMLAVFLIHS